MKPSAKVRVSKNFTIHLPKTVAETVGIKEGDTLMVTVEGRRIALEPLPDPFELALKAPKYAETTFQEFEEETEKIQSWLFEK